MENPLNVKNAWKGYEKRCNGQTPKEAAHKLLTPSEIFSTYVFFHPLNPFWCLILKSLFPKKELKNSFQPGRNILYRVMGRDRRISARPGAFGPDNYHIATNKLPAYEEALISYLKGILSLFLLLS